MKTKTNNNLNLVEGGKQEFEESNDFASRVRAITEEVTDKYAPRLLHETNWVKRLFIKIRRNVEIRKRIETLSSLKNLHVMRLSHTIV